VSAEWLTQEFDGRRRKRVLVKIIGEVRPVRPKLGQSA
jgi:hypothetical protein